MNKGNESESFTQPAITYTAIVDDNVELDDDLLSMELIFYFTKTH